MQKEVTVSNTLHGKALQLFPSDVHYTLAEFTIESKIQLSLMWKPSFLMTEYLASDVSSVLTLYWYMCKTMCYNYLHGQLHYQKYNCGKLRIKIKHGTRTLPYSCCPGASNTTELALGGRR